MVTCCEPKAKFNDQGTCYESKDYWNDQVISYESKEYRTDEVIERPASPMIAASQPQPYWNAIHRPMEVYIVKVTAEINGDGESFDTIAQMEATCNVCYHFIQEADHISVLKTKCICRLNKCDVCSQIIKYIPVTLSKSTGGGPVDLVIDIGGSEDLKLPESSKSRINGSRSYLTVKAAETGQLVESIVTIFSSLPSSPRSPHATRRVKLSNGK
ncbi:hypothetical protein CASFOL_024060 [Castilleja foliolosa]|uniref:Uncharacterized protein n=1 Tax=Castilleja foliolosa TaxID=1961234 RepID=A0ABD3CQ89_9LAMI